MDDTLCGLIDAPALPVYDLGADHPFARHRQLPLFDLIDRMGMATPAERMTAVPAGPLDLELAHDADYIAMVEATSAARTTPAQRASALGFGLGTSDNPIAVGQHAAAAAVVGATLTCVRAVLAGQRRHALNTAGGLHHAFRRRASGFCIYNDLVAGIRAARQAGVDRVLYVDFDVHHGDGVEDAFAGDPGVVTVSFHQSPETLFPGTGRAEDIGRGAARGSIVNMPFAPFTDDASWWECVAAILPAVVRRFRPGLIVSQHGCDPHREDPLAQLMLTTAPMRRAARMVRELADEVCGGRWVATGGGGYQPYSVTPRAWSLVWLEMSERPVPTRIDPGWIAAWQPECAEPLAAEFEDAPVAASPRTAQAQEINRRTLDRVLSLQGI
ncbi:MAG: acetoin utilization protein AcuC [Planctomycetes bacterium]|nr:acetoin utilization protein AcuC [Planctomycetota bacterium]MCB9869945.1 acetoin utilization protein AcuC [Planctomycetota bacterium]